MSVMTKTAGDVFSTTFFEVNLFITFLFQISCENIRLLGRQFVDYQLLSCFCSLKPEFSCVFCPLISLILFNIWLGRVSDVREELWLFLAFFNYSLGYSFLSLLKLMKFSLFLIGQYLFNTYIFELLLHTMEWFY